MTFCSFFGGEGMATQFSIRDFFRRMPVNLIARYFQERHNWEWPLSTQDENLEEVLMAAWTNLSDEIRRIAEGDFVKLHEMSDGAGITALLDEANFHRQKEKLQEEWGNDTSIEERVFLAFLNHPDFWKGALCFHQADAIGDRWWKKLKNLAKVPADVTTEAIVFFEKELGQFFFEHYGKGRRCHVDVFRRNELDYFFAYPEDYCRQTLEWEGSELKSRSTKFADQIIFVYDQREGTLDIYCKGIRKQVTELQRIFATCILHTDELPINKKDERIYDLSPLISPEFKFKFSLFSPIEMAAISRIRLTPRYSTDHRVIFEAPKWAENPKSIYKWLSKWSRIENIDAYFVTQAEIKVRIQEGAKVVTETIRLTWPNSCSLHHDERGEMLRKMLSDSGIELKENGETSQTNN